MFLANTWEDYEVLDMGDGEKLERWGNVILRRPDPQTIWPKADPALWKQARKNRCRRMPPEKVPGTPPEGSLVLFSYVSLLFICIFPTRRRSLLQCGMCAAGPPAAAGSRARASAQGRSAWIIHAAKCEEAEAMLLPATV